MFLRFRVLEHAQAEGDLGGRRGAEVEQLAEELVDLQLCVFNDHCSLSFS